MLWALAAFTMWGLSVLFWPLLEPASALEILLQRVLWSFVVVAILMSITRGWSRLRGLPRRTWMMVATGAILNAGNWGLFTFAVVSDQIVGASIAYFLNPLASAALGVLVLHERLHVSQTVALAIGALAVVVIGFANEGNPVLPVLMAACFGLYALVQRTIHLAPLPTLAGESTILLPAAVAGLIILQVNGGSTFVGFGAGHTLFFAAGGVMSVLPLIAFGMAARRVPLSTMATMQYVAPTLQFLIGVFIAHEPMPPARWVGFALILVAISVFTVGQLRDSRGR